jgi:Ca-activated chloride channel family protein
MIADLTLLAPAWLLALPLAIVLPRWLCRQGRTLPRIVAPLPVRHPAAARVPAPAHPAHAPRRGWLLTLALALMVLALAEPARRGPALPTEASATALMLLVDASVSMVLTDYALDGERIDRLAMAKRLIDRFVASLDRERVGLVVVGSPSAVWVPPTADRVLLRQALARLELTLAGRNAAIGDALVLTAEHLRDAHQRVAVLVSDGSGWVGRHNPDEGAERLRAAGITLYVIGVGATGPEVTRQRHGDLIYEPADMALLGRLAEHTGGVAFHATDSAAVGEILTAIRQRHGEAPPPADAPRLTVPLYHWPMIAGLLLLGGLPWLSVRPGPRGTRQ